jgi:hypothetical protein
MTRDGLIGKSLIQHPDGQEFGTVDILQKSNDISDTLTFRQSNRLARTPQTPVSTFST